MDIGSAFASLGRDLLVALGLAVLVNVGFEPPILVHDGSGGSILEARLSGAVTEEILPLLDRSVRVTIRVDFSILGRDGSKETRSSAKTISYRSIDSRYVIEWPGGSSTSESMDEAIRLVETHRVDIGRRDVRSVIMTGHLDIPSIPDGDAVRALWRDRVPSAVFEPESP